MLQLQSRHRPQWQTRNQARGEPEQEEINQEEEPWVTESDAGRLQGTWITCWVRGDFDREAKEFGFKERTDIEYKYRSQSRLKMRLVANNDGIEVRWWIKHEQRLWKEFSEGQSQFRGRKKWSGKSVYKWSEIKTRQSQWVALEPGQSSGREWSWCTSGTEPK